MKADLFNRVSRQLSSRTGVAVYARMPVLAFELGSDVPRVQRLDPQSGQLSVDDKQYRRLSPFNPVARQRIGGSTRIWRRTPFKGILFHDDALLSDFEDAGPDAVAAYRRAGFADSVAAIRRDPQQMARWTRFKSRALIAFTQSLTERVRAIRGPQVQTARNIYAMPVLDPASEAGSARTADFLQAYDWVAPMAMPLMENVSRADSGRWLDQLVGKVAAYPGALDKTVFELQAVDWRKERRISWMTVNCWPNGCVACSAMALRALVITPTTSSTIGLSWMPFARCCPQHGSHCHDRSFNCLIYPVHGVERAFRHRPAVYRRSAAQLRVFLAAVHVRYLDRRWYLFLAAPRAPLALEPGHARAGAAGQPVDQRADPCFNEGLNARETISAAMAQRYENIEVIAINDGSSDDTAEVLDQLTLEFPACG